MPSSCSQIKELEDEVSRQRAANEQLTAALAQASAAQSKLQLQLSMAEQQCAAAKAASATASSAASAAAKPSAYIAQLEQLVDSELAKGLALETQLAAAQERLLQAEQRTAAAKEQASAAAAEAQRSAAALGAELEAVRQELSGVRAGLKCCGLEAAEGGWAAGAQWLLLFVAGLLLKPQLLFLLTPSAVTLVGLAVAAARLNVWLLCRCCAVRWVTEGASALSAAQLSARLEAKRCSAEKEMHRATQQQAAHLGQRLEAAQAEVEALQSALGQARAQLAGRASTGLTNDATGLAGGGTGHAELEVAVLQREVSRLRQQLQRQPGSSGQEGSGLGSPRLDGAAGTQAAAALVAELRGQLAAAQEQLQAWAQVLAALPPGTQDAAAAAVLVKQQVAQLRDARSALQARECELVEVRVLCDAAQARVQDLSAEAAATRASAQAALTDAAIANKKLSVVQQERDSLARALAEPLPGGDGAPSSVGARLAAAKVASRAAQAEARVLDLTFSADTAQASAALLSCGAGAGQLRPPTQAQCCCVDVSFHLTLSALLRAEVERLLRSESAARSEAEAAKARAAAAEARVASLEKEADGLAREVAGLQEKLGRGEFGKSGSVRVLHLRMNPESQYQQQAAEGEMGALRAEVTALRASVSDLEGQLATARQQAQAAAPLSGSGPDSGQAVAAGVGVAGLAVKDAEIAVLKHKVAEADKASARLKEVFKERAAAFREAVYLLFGYRMELTSEATAARNAANAPTTITLRPQHADDAQAVLLFRSLPHPQVVLATLLLLPLLALVSTWCCGDGGARYTKERGMEMVATPFTSTRLAREVDTFVNRFRSIPALTANLTMELFQKQTQC
ncbi:hypothetical protein QJQ45_016348 [Haematococcus lacustris]|nr:hypothetical protein QJQ45_016348 [Haematococcus lacustris]